MLCFILKVDGSFFEKIIISIYQNTFFYNSYIIDIFELSSELLLIFFVLYSTLSVFTDRKKPIFQYYRLCYFIFIVFLGLLSQVYFFPYTKAKLFWQGNLLCSYYTMCSKVILLFLTLLFLLVARQQLQSAVKRTRMFEYPLVVSYSLLFMFLLLSAYNFFFVYVVLEALNFTLYTMAGMCSTSVISSEGTLKYYTVGAVSSGFFLYGLSILYSLVGSLGFKEVSCYLSGLEVIDMVYLDSSYIAVTCLIIGLLFKISAVPCHVWVADVYEGIFLPITLFLAVITKTAFFLVFIRVIPALANGLMLSYIQNILIIASLGSMVVGAGSALRQKKIKRFIAYTSVNQAGFVLLGVASCTETGTAVAILHVFLYAITSMSFFMLLLNTYHVGNQRSIVYLSDLYRFSEECKLHLIVLLLSLSGLPPLGGFLAKLLIYMVAKFLGLSLTILLILLVGILTVFNYLGLIHQMYLESSQVKRLYTFDGDVVILYVLRLFSLVLCIIVWFMYDIIFSISEMMSVSCWWPFLFY